MRKQLVSALLVGIAAASLQVPSSGAAAASPRSAPPAVSATDIVPSGAARAKATKASKKVRPLIVIAATTSKVVIGETAMINGQVSPAPRKAKYRLEKLTGARWGAVSDAAVKVSRGELTATFTPPAGAAQYRVSIAKTKKSKAAVSKPVTVTAAAKETTPPPPPPPPLPPVEPATPTTVSAALTGPASVVRGQQITFTGAVAPASATGTLTLQQLVEGDWADIATAPAGSYSLSTTPVAGSHIYRVAFTAAGKFTDSHSAKITVRAQGKGSVDVIVNGVPDGQAAAITLTAPDGSTRSLTGSDRIADAPEGTWTVAAAPFKNGAGDTVHPTNATQTAVVLDEQSATVLVDYAIIVAAETEVLSAASLTSVVADPTDPTLLTIRTTDTTIAKGDIVVSDVTAATPHGMLARVLEVGGGQVIATTENVTFMDAIPTGSFDIEVSLDASDLSPSAASLVAPETAAAIGSASKSASVAPSADDDTPSPDPSPTSSPSPTPPVSTDKPKLDLDEDMIKPKDDLLSRLKENTSCEGEAVATVEADFGVTTDVKLDADWGWLELNSAKFTAEVTEKAAAQISVEGTGSCTLEETNVFAEPLEFKDVRFMVGTVPVTVTPSLQVFVDANGTVSAKVSAGFEQSFTAGAGLAWTKDRGFSPVRFTNSEMKRWGPTVEATGSLEAGVKPAMYFAFYGIAGPTVALRGSAQLSADINKDPWWQLDGTFAATAKFESQYLNLSSGELPIFSYTQTLAQADTEPPNSMPISVDSDPVELIIGGPHGTTEARAKFVVDDSHVGQELTAVLSGVSAQPYAQYHELRVTGPDSQLYQHSFQMPGGKVTFIPRVAGTYRVHYKPGAGVTEGRADVNVHTTLVLDAVADQELTVDTTKRPGRPIVVRLDGDRDDVVSLTFPNRWFNPVLYDVSEQSVVNTLRPTYYDDFTYALPRAGRYELRLETYLGEGKTVFTAHSAVEVSSALNSTESLALPVPGQVGVVSFDAKAGEEFRFAFPGGRVVGATPYQMEGDMLVLDPADRVVASVGWDGYGDYKPTETGTHRLVFDPRGATAKGTQKVTISTPQVVNTSLSEDYVTLDSNGVPTRVLKARFTVDEPRWIAVSSESADVDKPAVPALRVRSVNGNALRCHVGSVCWLPEPGTYEVAFDSYTSPESFVVRADLYDPVAGRLSVDASNDVSVDVPKQVAAYRLDLTKDQELTYSFDDSDTGIPLNGVSATIVSPGKYDEYTNNLTGDRTLRTTAQTTGEYLVIVQFSASSAGTGAAKLTVSTPRAWTTAVGQPLQLGSGGIPGRTHVVSFAATQGQILNYALIDPTTGWQRSGYGAPALYGPNGQQISLPRTAFKVPADGTYKLRFDPQNSYHGGATLWIQEAALAQADTSGAAMEFRPFPNQPGKVTAFAFQMAQGQTYSYAAGVHDLVYDAGHTVGVGYFVIGPNGHSDLWYAPAGTAAVTGTYYLIASAGSATDGKGRVMLTVN